MPVTVNGIGTRYVGKKKLRTHVGQCEACHKSLKLQDYEARLWICVLYVPIVPLWRKQVTRYCPACTHHGTMDLRQWQEASRERIEEGYARVSEDPNDPDAAMELLYLLEMFGRREEATQLAGEMKQIFHDSAEVQLNLGARYESVGQDAEADAAFARSLELEPDSRPARRAVALAAIETGDLSRARELLRFMEEPGEDQDLGVRFLLAQACQNKGQDDQALDLFRIALAADPHLGQDRLFRKAVRRSEATLPQHETILPHRPLLRRRGFWAAAVAAAVILAVLGTSFYISTHRVLHVVNGLPTPVEVTVGGHAAVTVPANGLETLALTEGAHQVTLVGSQGQREEVGLTIDGTFFGRFFDDPVYVLNAFGAAACLWQEHVYAPEGTPPIASRPKEQIHLGQSFLHFEDIDYLFKEFPEEISTDTLGVMYRTRLSTLPLGASRIVLLSRSVNLAPMADLMRFAESHLRACPDDGTLLPLYWSLSAQETQTARCRDFLAEGLDARPLRIDWHRYYQEACHGTGRGQALEGYYAGLLEADPDNSVLLYLMGRLQGRAGESLAYMAKAIAADSENRYAWMAKGHALHARGQFAEAKQALLAASKLAPDNADVAHQLFQTRFALREFDDLQLELRKALTQGPQDLLAQIRLLRVLSAAGDLAGARRAHETYARAVETDWPGDPAELELPSRLCLLYMEGDLDGTLTAVKGARPADDLNAMAATICLESGRVREALEWSAKVPEKNWQHDLAVSIALHADGNVDESIVWREKARKKLADGGREERLFEQLLGQGGAADSALAADVVGPPVPKAIVLVALVQAGADDKLLTLAEALNYSPIFPQRLLQRTINQLTSP